jgi:hypothetical protein
VLRYHAPIFWGGGGGEFFGPDLVPKLPLKIHDHAFGDDCTFSLMYTEFCAEDSLIEISPIWFFKWNGTWCKKFYAHDCNKRNIYKPFKKLKHDNNNVLKFTFCNIYFLPRWRVCPQNSLNNMAQTMRTIIYSSFEEFDSCAIDSYK